MNNEGYFTIEQMDRANLKTMANPLPAPWNGSHLLSLLIVLSDMGVVRDMSSKDSKENVVEWYCTTKTDDVVEALRRFSHSDEFKAVMQIQEMAATRPNELRKAIEAIEAGWRPE